MSSGVLEYRIEEHNWLESSKKSETCLKNLMATFQGLGAKFDGPGSQGFHSSISGSSSSPFVQPSGASSQTSVSLDSNGCLLPPTTHDTIKSNHHMKDLERFVGDLQLSAKRAFPNSGYSRYKEVEVLLIRWVEDELEVEWELNELQQVFRDEYGFSTEQFLIPSQNAHRKLNRKVLSFVEEHEREDVLLIVYYGGHGVINKARQATWSCKTDKTYATVEWSAIQTLFEMAQCDVLLLLDCCAGASAAPLTERPTNIKETIAACGFETWAPRPGPQSFTKTLIEVLKEWAPQLPFSAAMLHSEILTRLKHQQPHRSSQGGWVESRKTPAYIVSTPDPHTASITLGRLVDPNPCSSGSSHAAAGTVSETLSEKIQGNGPVSSEDRLEALLAMDAKGERKAPHVLLTIALEEDQVYDTASCARWLKQFPLLAKYVSVEGVFRSYSTLLLLSVPVVLWDLLPDHPAVQFVGYVRSQNLAPSNLSQDSTASPIPIFGSSMGSGVEINISEEGYPLKSVSGLSSIDSGYGSCRLAGPTSSSTSLRNGLWMANLRGNWRDPTREQNPPATRMAKSSPSRLLGAPEPTSQSTDPELQGKKDSPKCRQTKRLVVMVDQADLDDDKSGLTCVLWYGHEVKRSKALKRTSSNPVWNEEFVFEVRDEQLFYHLGVSVWGGHMSELIGDLHIDLRGLVLKGQLPDLNKWQSLRCDGRTTGVIRFDLQYLDASEDEERKAEASNATGKSQEQLRQQQERQQFNDGQSRIDDFRVW